MQLRKYRWSKHYESAEEELFSYLASRGLEAERREAKAGDAPTLESSDGDRRLFCAEGSAVIDIANRTYSVQPGDALDIPDGTSYTITPGMTGVVCYQAI